MTMNTVMEEEGIDVSIMGLTSSNKMSPELLELLQQPTGYKESIHSRKFLEFLFLQTFIDKFNSHLP